MLKLTLQLSKKVEDKIGAETWNYWEQSCGHLTTIFSNGCNFTRKKLGDKKTEEHLIQIINPLHPKISMHILHDKEILLNNQELQNLLIIFLYSPDLNVWFRGECEEKLDASHFDGLEG